MVTVERRCIVCDSIREMNHNSHRCDGSNKIQKKIEKINTRKNNLFVNKYCSYTITMDYLIITNGPIEINCFITLIFSYSRYNIPFPKPMMGKDTI